MKKLLTLLLVAIALQAQSQSDELLNSLKFNNLKDEQKEGYGSKADPIPSGTFKSIANQANIQMQMNKFKNSYRWPDGSIIDFSKRFSTPGAGGRGILDCYTLVQAGKTDTIMLFVDPYRDAEVYYTPKGLIALNKAVLAKELAPYVKIAEELDAAPDPYVVKTSGKLGLYISKQLGNELFIDEDILTPVFQDTAAGMILQGFLFRTYKYNKLVAYAKELPDPKKYAYDKLKITFKKFQLAHPDVSTGSLGTTLK